MKRRSFSAEQIRGGSAYCTGESVMRTAANFLWFILNGFWMGLCWWFFGLLAAITVVGLPWARACFVIGQMAFHPFGREAISRLELTGRDDLGTGGLGAVGNIIWFVFAGAWLALGHIVWGIANCITIIGIPFGIQHFKLASLALFPVGKTIVRKEVAQAARNDNAHATLMRLQRMNRL